MYSIWGNALLLLLFIYVCSMDTFFSSSWAISISLGLLSFLSVAGFFFLYFQVFHHVGHVARRLDVLGAQITLHRCSHPLTWNKITSCSCVTLKQLIWRHGVVTDISFFLFLFPPLLGLFYSFKDTSLLTYRSALLPSRRERCDERYVRVSILPSAKREGASIDIC